MEESKNFAKDPGRGDQVACPYFYAKQNAQQNLNRENGQFGTLGQARSYGGPFPEKRSFATIQSEDHRHGVKTNLPLNSLTQVKGLTPVSALHEISYTPRRREHEAY